MFCGLISRCVNGRRDCFDRSLAFIKLYNGVAFLIGNRHLDDAIQFVYFTFYMMFAACTGHTGVMQHNDAAMAVIIPKPEILLVSFMLRRL